MRSLSELIDTVEPGIDLIREWVAAAELPCEVLPPSGRRADVLLGVQVTTRSPLGALAYETGGVLVDGGWLRLLGSGHERLTRDLATWNQGKSDGFYLVADDAVGGFFALNGGALGDDLRNVYYWPPDSLQWEPLGLGFSDFFRWALTRRLDQFYEDARWPTWREETQTLAGDDCFAFYPFLWTREGSPTTSQRSAVPIAEAYALKMSAIEQLGRR